jgi:hypothetical protein
MQQQRCDVHEAQTRKEISKCIVALHASVTFASVSAQKHAATGLEAGSPSDGHTRRDSDRHRG